MDQPLLEDRVTALERQMETQVDHTILLQESVFNLMKVMGKDLDDDEEYQHIRQMAALIRERQQRGRP